MSLEKFIPAKERSSYTNEMEYCSSVFAISNIPIKYYMTNVRLTALEDTFLLVEDIPGSSDWGYNAIFQRDIDDDRVENELLKKYLLNPNKFKFFNPLTIALLPFDGEENLILDNYTDHKKDNDAEWSIEKIGGIEINHLKGSSIGKIMWDKNKICGVAIDGQHRLSALMKYAKDPDRPRGVNPADVMIPVVLLVFDINQGNILKQIREIFVDINKNAEPVSGGRRILLDDRDVFAVFARDLIESEEYPDGLPYEVIDWKHKSARPENQQISTVIVLYEIVKLIFKNSSRKIEQLLILNAELAREKVKQLSINDSVDDFNEFQIQVALKKFRDTYKKTIVSIFEKISPYEKLIEELSKHVDGDDEKHKAFKEYLFKPDKKRDRYKSELATRGFDIQQLINEPMDKIQEIKNEKLSELLFLSVVQRAIFVWFELIEKIYELNGVHSLEEITEKYIHDLNLLIQLGFFTKSFSITIDKNKIIVWNGIILRGDKINPSKAAAKRMGAMITLAIAYLNIENFDVRKLPDPKNINLATPLKEIKSEYGKVWQGILEETWEVDVDDWDDDNIDIESDNFIQDAEEYSISTIAKILQTIGDKSKT